MIVISALRDAGNLPVYWQAYNKKGIGLTEEQQGQISFNGRDGNDLSWNTVMAIIERMASDHPAALMIQDTEQSGEADYNIEKLYLMLMQYGPKTFYDYFVKDNSGFVSQEVTVDGRTFVTGAYKSSEDASAVTVWNEETFLTQYGISVMHESQILVRGGIEVFGNIVTFGGNWNVYTDFSEITPADMGMIITGRAGTVSCLIIMRSRPGAGLRPLTWGRQFTMRCSMLVEILDIKRVCIFWKSLRTVNLFTAKRDGSYFIRV